MLLMKLLSEGHRLFLNRDVASESRVLEPQQLSYRDPGCTRSAPRMCGELARDMHPEGFPILAWGWGLGCPLGKDVAQGPSFPPSRSAVLHSHWPGLSGSHKDPQVPEKPPQGLHRKPHGP